jgi:hypothetical protein
MFLISNRTWISRVPLATLFTIGVATLRPMGCNADSPTEANVLFTTRWFQIAPENVKRIRNISHKAGSDFTIIFVNDLACSQPNGTLPSEFRVKGVPSGSFRVGQFVADGITDLHGKQTPVVRVLGETERHNLGCRTS